MKSRSAYPLRLPRSIKAEVERRAEADGTSVNQFVATAVAEKLAAMSTAEFFSERRDRADFAAFDRLMRRTGGERPAPDDTIADHSPAFIGIKEYIEMKNGMHRRQEFYQPVMIKVLLENNGTVSAATIAATFHRHDSTRDLKYYEDLLTTRRRARGTVGYVLEKNGQVEWVDSGYRLRHNVGELTREERDELIRLLDEEIATRKSSYRGDLARQTERP
jgi:hypothetical protein